MPLFRASTPRTRWPPCTGGQAFGGSRVDLLVNPRLGPVLLDGRLIGVACRYSADEVAPADGDPIAIFVHLGTKRPACPAACGVPQDSPGAASEARRAWPTEVEGDRPLTAALPPVLRGAERRRRRARSATARAGEPPLVVAPHAAERCNMSAMTASSVGPSWSRIIPRSRDHRSRGPRPTRTGCVDAALPSC